MSITVKTYKELVEALHKQGFFLVADLPPNRIENRRGSIIVRFP